jgi:hypothetical protein
MGNPVIINSDRFNISCNRCKSTNVRFEYDDGDIIIVCCNCEDETPKFDSLRSIVKHITESDRCMLSIAELTNVLNILSDLPDPKIRRIREIEDLISYVIKYDDEDYYLYDIRLDLLGTFMCLTDEKTGTKDIKLDLAGDIKKFIE